MLKPSKISDDFDDVSLAPITGEGKALEPDPKQFDDEKVKKLLAELDALESSSNTFTPSVSSIPLKNSLPSKNDESFRKETPNVTEVKNFSQTEVSNENLVETPQKPIEDSSLKESPKKIKKALLQPNNSLSKTENGESKSSLLKVVAVGFVTLLLVVGGVAYSFWQSSTEEVNAVLPVETQEVFADVSDEATNFVRKSNSKLAGTTIEQALGNYLNSSLGQNWQALGWKSSLEQEKQNSFSVTFVWKEGQKRKETSWQLDMQAKKLVPTDSIAEEVTLTNPINFNALPPAPENAQNPDNAPSTQKPEKQNNNTNANIKVNTQHID